MTQRVGRLGAVGSDDASLGSGDGQRERSSAPRPRVVGQERDADRRLRREPWLELVDGVHAHDLDAARVEDGLGEGGRQVLRRLEPGGLPAVGGGAVRAGRRGGDGVEVEAELQLAARGRTGAPARPGPQPSGRPPATRAAGT